MSEDTIDNALASRRMTALLDFNLLRMQAVRASLIARL
jgi:hypothetical protein